MLVLILVAMIAMFGSVSGYAYGLNLTIRYFDTAGVVYTGDDLPLFYTAKTAEPIIQYTENGKNITLNSWGLEHENVKKTLPYESYSYEVPNYYFPTISWIKVKETLCYFKYFGTDYMDGISYRTVRDVIVTLTFPSGYYNTSTGPNNLPVFSLALQLEEKSIGKINFPIYITNGTAVVKYRVVVHFDGSYSVTRTQ